MASSPTPAGGRGQSTILPRRASTRQANRRLQQFANIEDSSDDEIPVPMKLSALTKAILGDGRATEAPPASAAVTEDGRKSPTGRPPSRAATRRSALATSASFQDVDNAEPGTEDGGVGRIRRHIRTSSAANMSSKGSPRSQSRDASPVTRKRVVRLSGTPGAASLQLGLKRSLSTCTQRRRPPSRNQVDEKRQSSAPATEKRPTDAINTPVAPVRTVRIQSSSQKSRREPPLDGKGSKSGDGDEDVQHNASTAGGPQNGPQSSMRVKRIGIVAGSFLSGPARRGRRRQSEEDADGQDGDLIDPYPDAEEKQAQGQHVSEGPVSSFPPSSYRDHDFAASGSPVHRKDLVRLAARKRDNSNSMDAAERRPQHPSRTPAEMVYKMAASPERRIDDKENERASDIKAPRIGGALQLEKAARRPPIQVDQGAAPLLETLPPERQVLAPRSQNIVHRPAPAPPPKMSVVETATRTAGAAAIGQATRKKQIFLRVNGEVYTRIDCVGRGGSSKVYRVSAENGKMLALKRVSLENADPCSIKGFKGEIELLKKLDGLDRVVQLIDAEVNEEKKTLSLVMELGELDLHSLIKSRQGHQEGAKFDGVFVRFYWKEMLECVQAVHARDVVHSDLKPANFVLVQGRLKLIDFGIANAIQTDMTANVHRETQIGTPNYMSPESLMDSNQYALTSTANNGGAAALSSRKGGPKLMKLGKPSDVWSLGCILYQMVYGHAPFGKIANQLSRCQAIINWSHPIHFPEVTECGSRVPLSLLRTMKRCLNRDQSERPSCDELLALTDPFLYPQEFGPAVLTAGEANVIPITEELLARIIQSIVQRCKERMPSEGEAMSTLPQAYWASVRKAVGAFVDKPQESRSHI